MTDIESRLLQLATDNRAETWAALQRADPNQAEWLKAMTAEFGKPDAIRIRVDGKEFRKGRTMRAQDYPDFHKRLAVTLAIVAKEARVSSRDTDSTQRRARN